MSKKIVSLLLAVVMLVSVFAVTASAAGLYSDTEGHWGEAAINRWSDEGIVVGFGDGSYHPDAMLNRAQSASVFTKLLKLTEKGDVSAYKDMVPGAWYTDDIACCVRRGILVGTSDTTMNPNAFVTREQFFTMFARAVGLKPEEKAVNAAADAPSVADWAQGYVNALSNRNYLDGLTKDGIDPQNMVGRAVAISVVNNAIAVYAQDANETVTASDKGITLVVADGVTVSGDTRGLVIAVPTEEGKQSVTKIESSKITDSLTVTSNTRVELGEGSNAADVVIEGTAAGAEIVVPKGVTIENVTVNAENVKVTGEGTVTTVATAANNTTVETKGTAVTAEAGVTGTTAPNGTVTEKQAETTDKTDKTDNTGETDTPTTPSTPTPVTPSGPVTPTTRTIPLTVTLSGKDKGSTLKTVSNSGSVKNVKVQTVLTEALSLLTDSKKTEIARTFAELGLSAKFGQIVEAAVAASLDPNNAAQWGEYVADATVETVSGTMTADQFKAAFGALAANNELVKSGEWKVTYSGYTVTIKLG